MAVGFPTKVTYANGDVFSASDINDTNGTINLINPTAKGSIVSASAANTPSRLSVGANSTFLRANSSATTGLEWAGAYTTFTPTWFQLTVGNGTNVGRYLRIGNFVHVVTSLTFGSTTSVSGPIFGYYPLAAASTMGAHLFGTAHQVDTGTQNYYGQIGYNDSTNFALYANVTSATYASITNATATVPFTWTTGDRLNINYVYETEAA